jgi:hypothetical protein
VTGCPGVPKGAGGLHGSVFGDPPANGSCREVYREVRSYGTRLRRRPSASQPTEPSSSVRPARPGGETTGATGASATVSVSEAGGPLPSSSEAISLVVLIFVPAVMPVTFTEKVHELLPHAGLSGAQRAKTVRARDRQIGETRTRAISTSVCVGRQHGGRACGASCAPPKTDRLRP